MNCQSFENVIDDLAREQLIEARLRKAALRHSDECSTCAQRLADERDLTLSLRALAEEMNSAAAPERVESFLLAAFTERRVSQESSRPKRWNYPRVAAAAAVLIAVGIGLAAWNSLVPSEPHEAISAIPAVTTSLDKPSATPQVTVVQAENPRPRSISMPRPSKRNKSVKSVVAPPLSETEVATDFMPIRYANPASLQDGGSIVRVELSRSTVVSMGFAVNMDRYGERVKADVLMGADGLARAIRFIE
jgi:hypothetical protein